MTLKLCQGTDCHTYTTQDRLKGTKPNKTYQTRRRTSFYYGDGNFCDQRCMYNWFQKFGDRAIDHFGRVTEVKHLTEQNAWVKDYNWSDGRGGYNNEDRNYFYHNMITKEQRPLTEEQYRDSNYTLNER